MSLWSKVGSVFSKSEQASLKDPGVVRLLAPLKGRLLALKDVPDEVFSQNFMGDGFAVDPTEGRVLAPLDCEVLQVFRTGHAVGLLASSGLEVLIHVGIDTVKLQGEGFRPLVEVGQKLKAGDPILDFDLEILRSKAKSLITPIVITNMDKVAAMELRELGTVDFLTEVAQVTCK